MKKLLFLITFVFSAMIVSAQDVIVKTDGSTILAKVLNVSNSEIQYKKFSNPDGPTYTISVSELISINYENGEKDTFSTPKTPADNKNEIYIPTKITAESASQYSNDIQLDRMYTVQSYKKTANKWLIGGCIGGTSLFLAGLILDLADSEGYIIGIPLMGVGAASCCTGIIFNRIYANRYKKALHTASIFGQDFNLNNGTKLNVGIDAINGYNFNERALGIGIRYNF